MLAAASAVIRLASESSAMTALFSPLELRETTVPNRVMVSPMCQNTSAEYIQRKRECTTGAVGTLTYSTYAQNK